jgi:hypothetical protein
MGTDRSFPHSAVGSALERNMLVIDSVDHSADAADRSRLLTLAQAKVSLPVVYKVVQETILLDCNAQKQHLPPGTMSIYQAPCHAIRCQGDPFIYVRWFRFSEDRMLAAFLLSNGAVQIFVGSQFELRWLEEDRKFLVRSNGVCEAVNETFALLPALNKLLHDV